MILAKYSGRHCSRTLTTAMRCYSSNVIYHNEADEYTTVPEYPPIVDLSREKKRERRKQAARNEVNSGRTVEERQIKLNMPKYYGFKCYMLEEKYVPYNNLPVTQHITRTHIIEDKDMACLPQQENEALDDFNKSLGSDVQEIILTEHDGYRRYDAIDAPPQEQSELNNQFASSVVDKVHRLIMTSAVAQKLKHLQDAQVDHDPRVEAAWSAGGMTPPENIRRWRKSHEFTKDMADEPTDRWMQYQGVPLMTLRVSEPLKPFVPFADCDHALDADAKYPAPALWKYDPRVVGLDTTYRRITNIPGFWPTPLNDRPNCKALPSFPLLSYHTICHTDERLYPDRTDALHRQAILASYGWLHALASYRGFSTFSELTYPLQTQTVLTNGRDWAFYAYQMNTTRMYGDVTQNPKVNLCWASGERRLYESVQDGKVVGFNSDVLRTILNMYSNVPEKPLGMSLEPFLEESNLKVSADYSDDEKCEWLEREYKFLMSKRPRFKLPYEIYHWEKIYKIDHKTRAMEARRRPFELGEHPFNRRLDERKPAYIPRCKRPDVKKHQGRNAKEYFP